MAARKPWSRTKAAKRVLSPDEAWAAKIAERILADCHPWQVDAATDPARRISMLVGRGGAKTTTKRVRALLKLISLRRASILYLATTRGQAEELNWFKLKDAVDNYGLTEHFQFSESKLRAICTRTGSIYTLAGAEDNRDIERYRGQPFDEVQIDEAASHDIERLKRLIYRIIAPRLGERDGCIVMGGTPGHRLAGEFYDATRPGSPLHRPYADRDKPEYQVPDSWKWSSHAWTLRDVADLPNAAKKYPALVKNWAEALIEKTSNKWSDDNPIWKREWLGCWAADDTDTVFRYRPHTEDGKPWNQWDPFGEHPLEGLQALKVAIAALPREFKDWRFVVPADMGHSDPFALNVLAFAPADPNRNIWHVFSFERTGMYAKPIAELLIGPDLNHERLGGIFGVIGWPDGQVMDADAATIDELANVYGVRFAKAERKPDYKQGAIELVNGDLVDGRIKILKGSPLAKQLMELQWSEDQYGRVKENKAQANHSTDTLVYGRKLIATLFETGSVEPAKKAGGGTPSAAQVYRDAMGLDDERDPADPPPKKDDDYDSMISSPDFDDWGST